MGVRNQLHDSVRTKACTADGGTYSAQQSMALSAKAGQREPGAPGKIDALMGKPWQRAHRSTEARCILWQIPQSICPQ